MAFSPGARFGHLTVLHTEGNRVVCRCDCGNETKPFKSNLLRGSTRTCGCSLSRKIQPGDRFGHLTVLSMNGQRITCRCDCGNEKDFNYSNLIHGTTSCGCMRCKKVTAGQRFGRLTTVKYTGHSLWLCRCDCGNEKVIRTDHLSTGSVKSCGYLRKEIIEDGLSALGDHQVVIAPGMKFGHPMVLSYAGHSNWLCRCDCGNEKEIQRSYLLSGQTKSCGCRKAKDIPEIPTGTRFGRLTVISSIGHRITCRCDCGNDVTVFQSALTSGNIKSCGCKGKKSPLETK